MLLNFDNDDPFATGMASYSYEEIGGEDCYRILIQIEVNEDIKWAILDTGGQYFFCTQELAERLGIDERECIKNKEINLRGFKVRGNLCRVDIILLRDEGTALPLQVTAFLPDIDQGLPASFLPYPFLGLFGCMERVRFAIDPSKDEERFYFGECSG